MKVNSNAKKISEGALTVFWDDAEQLPLLQYYTGSDGVLMLAIRENRLRVMFDGQHLVVLASEPRKQTRGLCGYMTSTPRQDYITPYGIVDKPEYYGATYALKDNIDQKTQQLQEQAKQAAYPYKKQYAPILRSDREWAAAMESSSSEEETSSHNVYRARSYLKQRGECKVQQQVQYYENHGEICISTTPVPSCQSHCRGLEYTIQPVQVVCRPKIDQQHVAYRNQIRQGLNPSVSGVPQLKQYRVPTACAA